MTRYFEVKVTGCTDCPNSSQAHYWGSVWDLKYKTIADTAQVQTQSTSRIKTPSPQALTPEDAGSDWFYKLSFICRVLEGVDPINQDKATALGMAQSLKRTRWTAEKALTPITAEDVTPDMEIAFHESCIREEADTTELIASAINAYLVIKHRSEA